MAARPTTAEQDTATTDAQRGLTPDVVATGSGYRAVMRRDAEIVWVCSHVHFTEHSARNCPSLQSAGVA